MSNHDYSEKIEAWLHGELPANEQSDFEKQIQSDPDLATEVQFQQDLNKALAEREVLQFRNALETARQAYRAENTEGAKVLEMRPKESARIFPLRRVLAIAAGLALLVTAGIWFLKKPAAISPESIFVANFNPPPTHDFTAGTRGNGDVSDAVEQLRNEAFDEYGKKNHAATLALLEKIPAAQLPPDEQPLHFYQLGVLYFLTGNDSKANEFLSMENAAEADSREWYKALILLKQNAPRETLKVAFSKMADTNGHAWQEEAKAVLKQLGM